MTLFQRRRTLNTHNYCHNFATVIGNKQLFFHTFKIKTMAEIYQLPDNGNSNNGVSGIPFSIPIGGFGNGGWGNNGFGMNSIADLFGLAIIASIFGWGGNNGFGNGWGGGNNAAGFLSNQLNNDSGRELIMNAVTSQGEASRTAIQNLATTLGQDYNTVFSAVQGLQSQLATLAASQGMSTLQVINAVQAGNCDLASKLAQCCCENRLLTTQQGYEAQIRTLEQTNQLGSQADRNTNALMSAINAQTVAMNDQFCALKERELQAKINSQADVITQLRGQIDNANQTAAITGYVNSLVAPLQAKVTEISDKMPNTVPVQWPNLTAVNTTPYVNGGFYGNGFGNIAF